MEFIRAFIVGGRRVVGQVHRFNKIDASKNNGALCWQVLYLARLEFIYSGRMGSAGATVPIIGFGNTLAKGVIEDVNEKGLLGA